ncbi:MAG: DUF3072 domain-containing protein [Alsobacter sp.]
MASARKPGTSQGKAGAPVNRVVEKTPGPFVGENPTQPSEAQGPGDPPDNRIKDPQDWVTGEEPMTGAQASYLKTLSEQVHDPHAFDPDLDKAQASERIDALKRRRDGG